jgi:hypothetical protein
MYLLNIVLFNLLATFIYPLDNFELFNIYIFVEFTIFVLIYYNLLEQKKNKAFKNTRNYF